MDAEVLAHWLDDYLCKKLRCALISTYKSDWVTALRGQCHWRESLMFLMVSWKWEAPTPCRVMRRSSSVVHEAERNMGRTQEETSLEFSWKGMRDSLGLASLNSAGGPWVFRTIPGSLVTGSGVIKDGRGSTGLGFGSYLKEVVQSVASGSQNFGC